MSFRRRLVYSRFFLFLASAIGFTGCSMLTEMNVKRPGGRVFITELPSGVPGYDAMRLAGYDLLRLAVKDNIDLAGVVTTAGSKYLEERGQPAKKDAACLAIV